MKIPYLAFLLLISNLVFSQNNFADLEYKLVNEFIEVGYPKSNFESIFKVCSQTNLCVGVGESDIVIGRFKLENNAFLNLYYSEGQSDDPQLIIEHKTKIILNVIGDKFHFRGKSLYVEGYSNNLFDKKRKFIFENGKFNEVKQPLYFVGIKGKLKRNIKIHETKDLTSIVATLPKNYPIEIVMAEFNENDIAEYFLVKTKFGLLGWLKIEMDDENGGLMDGFYFHGD
ncbi:hypothetical protein [Winogradskyella sp. A2]|uniref:hypothetical protein n=1 Tax=Winogradskyella sp. A2 TaxID=3366944 RepID=UPI00398C3294